MSFGKGGANASQAPAATSLKVQTSVFGAVIAIIFGTTRAKPNLIFYNDFTATQAASSGGKGGGGKGGGGGGGKGGAGAAGGVSYTYSASLQLALCEGPINGYGAVFTNKQVNTLAQIGLTAFDGTYPQAPWAFLTTNHSAVTEEDTIPGSPYQVTVGFAAGFIADAGVIDSAGNVYTAVGSSPGNQQYVSFAGTYTFSSANQGSQVEISYRSSTQQPPDQALGYNGIAHVDVAHFNLGNAPQLPQNNLEVFGIGSLATDLEPRTVPAGAPYTLQANRSLSVDNSVNSQTSAVSRVTIVYFVSDGGVKYTGGAALTKVTSAPSTGQYSVSTAGLYTFAAGDAGQNVTLTYSYYGDADPSVVITRLLTDAHFGAGFPPARLGNLATYQAYCLATGLRISPDYDQQVTSKSMLDDIATVTNSAFVWTGGQLTIVPYGDQNVSGNGYTYTAPSAPLFNLTDDDFLENQNATGSGNTTNTDPVLITRTRPSDQINSIKVEFLNRASLYNPEIIEARDQALIDSFTLRQDPSRQQHMVCDAVVARFSAQLQLQREAIRNIYEFTLDQRYVLLDPMDIVTLTDAALQLNQQWVRITEITENDDGTLSITAEEYLAGTGHAAQYAFQASQGFAADTNIPPGNINTPLIFEAPVQIAATGLEVWVAVSGSNPAWGGCDIWGSTDGNTYGLLGRVVGPMRQGVLSAVFPTGTDPDRANTLAVDLTESGGALQSGTQQDADLAHTLCYVDGEYVSYQQATLISTSKYDLGSVPGTPGYLRRGLYNTMITTHAAGSQFARLDSQIFKYSYDKSKIGLTLYLKFLSFNLYGGAEQSLSQVSPYTHVIAGPPAPPNVTGFIAQQLGESVSFKWNPIPNTVDDAIKGYDILYSTQSQTIASAISLTESSKGTEMTNADVPAGAWTFWIRARDLADQLSPNPSSFNLTVVLIDLPIIDSEQDATWLGVYS